jgi:hypothetical protein
MSIDARIQDVQVYQDGSGCLFLIDRPARRPGHAPGIAGQNTLHFRQAPPGIQDLKGLDVWGGDSQLVLGDQTIARREGFTNIEFVPAADLLAALTRYRHRSHL